MSQLRVPRVHIVIPSKHTSRHMFEPRYKLPLFAAEHAQSLDDPANPVHEEDHPLDCRSADFYWMEIDSVEEEFERCLRMFPRVFGRVYATREAFMHAMEAEVDRGVAIEASIERALAAPETAEVVIPKWLTDLTIKGLTPERKRALVLRGLDTPAAVKAMDKLKIAEVIGPRAAKELKAIIDRDAIVDEATIEDDAEIARKIPAPTKG